MTVTSEVSGLCLQMLVDVGDTLPASSIIAEVEGDIFHTAPGFDQNTRKIPTDLIIDGFPPLLSNNLREVYGLR